MTTPQDILDDLLAALRDDGSFATVALGSAGNDTAVPRAELAFEQLQELPGDPWPDTRWLRLTVRLFITTRADNPTDAHRRLHQLALAAANAVLADPTRDGHCCDLPAEKATEVHQTQLPRDQRHPQRQSSLQPATPTQEISLLLRCHYEIDLPGSFPAAARIDDRDLFSTGPCTFTPGPWTNQTLLRSIPGIDGQVALDLGRRSRTILQQGRLTATDEADLLAQLEDLTALQDGQLHTLTDHAGCTFPQVYIESFTHEPPVQRAVLRCPYSITWRELP